MTNLTEIMARGMWQAREETMPRRTRMKYDARTPAADAVMKSMSKAALAAIHEAGFVVVPVGLLQKTVTLRDEFWEDDVRKAMTQAGAVK